MLEDGQADPVGVTNVLAKAAKMEGVQIFEKTPVVKILIKNNKIMFKPLLLFPVFLLMLVSVELLSKH